MSQRQANRHDLSDTFWLSVLGVVICLSAETVIRSRFGVVGLNISDSIWGLLSCF